MTPLLCTCAVVITLGTQKCRQRAPRSVEFNLFINCDRQKRFSQNERRRANVQIVDSDFVFLSRDLAMIFQNLVRDKNNEKNVKAIASTSGTKLKRARKANIA